ncbi:MAG: hypothetical protein COU67_01290 [Candidatus Pacebacteria bacterium CG10_big_fil_rev_8_21_14_0_10_44_54]|nr:DUF359 domain-containing protein [Candidatus Paceibacterota bacterium]PIR60573.1 MAG: hypothetical protein COU67_01290 [Candidatus Pacebacteria bacterium CG10_big_fil_rev_8_21_14_0_10_44_54]
MTKKYKLAGLGGTFDHFHLGHQALIDEAGSIAEKLAIGVTTDVFARSLEKQAAATLEPFAARVKDVENYCKQKHYPCKIFPLKNIFGPTILSDTKIDVLCVSSDTMPGADIINQTRTKQNLPVLPIVQVPLVMLCDGTPLSSTSIRQGVASRNGRLYNQALAKTIVLDKKQREFFAEIQGEVLEQPTSSKGLQIVVGDSSLQKFLANSWKHDLAVFDYRIQRKIYYPPVVPNHQIELLAVNPAGSISIHLTKTLTAALKKKHRYIFVEGEEDLAAAVLILLAPLGTAIYYGQPRTGLVCIHLTEEKKNKIYKILLQ